MASWYSGGSASAAQHAPAAHPPHLVSLSHAASQAGAAEPSSAPLVLPGSLLAASPSSPPHSASALPAVSQPLPGPPTAPSGSPSSSPSPPRLQGSASMFCAGLVSGVLVAGLFNPWDRALYLSVVHERRFLHRSNFVQPYKGFYQALFFRTLSSGLYFPLFDTFTPLYRQLFSRMDGEPAAASSSSPATGPVAASALAPSSPPSPRSSHPLLVHFMAGNSAGAVSGAVLNGLTAIKYASWESERGGFSSTARAMWRQGGVRPFMKGIVPTVLRDTLFGGVFALSKEGCARALRGLQRRAASQQPPSVVARSLYAFTQHNTKSVDFLSSLIAGALGTVVSSPFNFVRNIKYGWPAADTPPSASRILQQLADEARRRRRQGGLQAALSHLQDRLRIGWGTARVAVGMAVGYEIYDLVKHRLEGGEQQQQQQQHSAAADTPA